MMEPKTRSQQIAAVRALIERRKKERAEMREAQAKVRALLEGTVEAKEPKPQRK